MKHNEDMLHYEYFKTLYFRGVFIFADSKKRKISAEKKKCTQCYLLLLFLRVGFVNSLKNKYVACGIY